MSSRFIDYSTDLKPSYMHEFKADYISSFVDKTKKVIVLDVGCWSGQMHKSLQINHDYHGIDVDKKVVESATIFGLEGKIKLGSATKIPFRSSYFDLVIYSDVIEHIPKGEEKRSLLEVKRVLKKEGLLFLTTPDDNFFSKLFDPAYFILNHRHYRQTYLKNIIADCGFKIVSSTKVGSWEHVLNHNLLLIFKHIFRRQVPERIADILTNKIKLKLKNSKKEGFLANYIVASKM